MAIECSVLIPARNERWLARTIEDLLAHSSDATEIIAVADGAWPDPPIKDHPRVTLLHYSESIGQRAATNRAAQIAQGRYLVKTDAHCAFDDQWDQKMLAAFKETGDNVIMAPAMRNLHVFDWVCQLGHRRYQGPSGPCKEVVDGKECGCPTEMEVRWIAKVNPTSTAYCLDNTLHFQYDGRWKRQQKGNICESMSLQGSFFMLTKERYEALDICSEQFYSWGAQAAEVSCKMWMSGGQVLVNRSTFYGHMFRTQGADFGFPFEQNNHAIEANRELSRELFMRSKWPLAKRPFSWVLDRFWPVPGWTEEQLDEIKASEASILSSLSFQQSGADLALPDPSTANETRRRQKMSSDAVQFPRETGATDVSALANQLKVVGIAAHPILTEVIEDEEVFSPSSGDGADEPSISKSMGEELLTVNRAELSIPVGADTRSPIPAPGFSINPDLGDEASDDGGGGTLNAQNGRFVHARSISDTTNNSKAIVWYSDNCLPIKFAKRCQRQLLRAAGDIPIFSVTLKPMPNFGNNICLPLERGKLAMFRQILAGLKASDADIIFLCEHDVMYSAEHFSFTPPRDDCFYYDQSVWRVREADGFAVAYDHDSTSMLCAYRELLVKEYTERVRRVAAEGFHGNGYEPGTRSIARGGYSDSPSDRWAAAVASLDIRHEGNLTASRWSISGFRDKSTCTNWRESTLAQIEGW